MVSTCRLPTLRCAVVRADAAAGIRTMACLLAVGGYSWPPMCAQVFTPFARLFALGRTSARWCGLHQAAPSTVAPAAAGIHERAGRITRFVRDVRESVPVSSAGARLSPAPGMPADCMPDRMPSVYNHVLQPA